MSVAKLGAGIKLWGAPIPGLSLEPRLTRIRSGELGAEGMDSEED